MLLPMTRLNILIKENIRDEPQNTDRKGNIAYHRPPSSSLTNKRSLILSIQLNCSRPNIIEVLLKGTAQDSWPPALTSLDQLLFMLKILFMFASYTSCLNEEVNCTETPPSTVSIPFTWAALSGKAVASGIWPLSNMSLNFLAFSLRTST